MASFVSALKAPFRLLTGNKPVVTILELQGAIGLQARPGRGLSASSVDGNLRKAFKNKGAKAVVLAINSPGGAPAQARMIMERCRHLARETQLPVFSYIEDVGASGGYLIALAGEEIWADPFAIVGSIGVVSAGFGFQDAIDKLGVERRVHTAGTNKVRLDPFREERPEDAEKLEAVLGETHAIFIDLVKTARGDRIAKEDEDLVFSGDFFLAERGQALGLVDQVGDLRAILKARFGHDVKVKLISAQRGGILGRFGAGLAGAFVDSASHKLREEGLRSRLGLS